MSVTDEEILAVIRGVATPEVLARVCATLSDPESPASKAVRGVEDWAKQTLGRNRETVATQPRNVAPTLLRKAAFAETSPAPAAPTLDDLIAVLQGNASDATKATVKAALSDPNSPLSEALRKAREGT